MSFHLILNYNSALKPRWLTLRTSKQPPQHSKYTFMYQKGMVIKVHGWRVEKPSAMSTMISICGTVRSERGQ